MDTFKLDLWDTAGQEKYESLGPMYYRNSDYIFLIFDITEKQSIHYCKKKIDELKKLLPNASFLLVGNKYDLFNNLYNENINLANNLSSLYNIKIIYVSAKNGYNIKKIFENVVYVPKVRIENINIEMDEDKKRCCTIC
jgi:small GTP-binding protein